MTALSLRVQCVPVPGDRALSQHELLAVCAYVRHEMSATSADSVIDEAALHPMAADRQCDCDGLDAFAAAEIRVIARHL